MQLSRLKDFMAWLDRRGIQHRPGKGEYQVLQVNRTGYGWLIVHKNKRDELTIDDRLQCLIGFFEMETSRACPECGAPSNCRLIITSNGGSMECPTCGLVVSVTSTADTAATMRKLLGWR